MLELARNRVTGFETEYRNVLEKLARNERNIEGVVEMRSKFLANQENTSRLEIELFQKRVEVLERRLELVQLNLILDKYTLDGCYEELQLQQLISGTKQKRVRDDEVDNMMRMGANQLIERLQFSILLRQDLVTESKLLLSRLDQLVTDFKSGCDNKSITQTKMLSQLANDLNNSNKKSSLTLRKVIEDSLVLRHNSRIAADLLTKRRFQEEQREVYLNESLSQFQSQFEAELKNVEISYQKEFDLKLQQKRTEIMRLEGIFDDMLTKSTDLKLKSKYIIDKYTQQRKSIESNYQQLQIRRREQIMTGKSELENLKNKLLAAESIVLNPVTAYNVNELPTGYTGNHIVQSQKPILSTTKGKNSRQQERQPGRSLDLNKDTLSEIQKRMKGLKQNLESSALISASS